MAGNPYGPPQIDLSGFNPVGSFEQGRELRRGYALRNALSKLAPDDFQGMAKALMQFGDPKEGVQAMQLQNQLRHQSFEEDLAKKTYGLNEQIRNDAINLRTEKLGAPIRSIQAQLPLFQDVRKEVLDPGWKGYASGYLGGSGAVLTDMAQAVAQATETDEKNAIEAMVPKPGDRYETRVQKIRLLENHIKALGATAESIGIGTAKDFAISPYDPNAEVQPHTVQTVPMPGAGGGEAASAAEARPGYPPAPAREGSVPAAAKDRVPDKLYTMPNGQKAYWRVFPGGQAGWEPVD